MYREQLAINSVTTTQQDLPEALSAYADAGFTNVEFVLPLVKDWLKEGHTLAEVRELLSAHKLRSIGGFETHVVCFGSEAEQAANEALLQENMQLVHDLGGGTMVVGTDGPAEAMPDALDRIAQRVRHLATISEDLNVQIAVEFNWSPIIRSLQSAVLLVQKVDHPRVGVLFDPAHYYTTPTKFADINAETVPYIKHVHVDDMRAQPADLSNCNSDRVLPGEGILNVGNLLHTLESYGYKGYFSIEMFSDELWQLSAAEAAQRCYQSLLPLCEAPQSVVKEG